MSLKAFAIQKRFGDVEALKGVDIEVKAGEFFTLLGPSGCGKTTLLRIIAGLELPDHGVIILNDRPVTGIPAKKRPVNTVFQSYALFPHMSVIENVCFGLISRKVSKAEAVEKAKKSLDMVQLNGYGDRMPKQLSGGQQQRVALARALVNEPELLLLDEPMSALDAKLRTQVQVELRQLQQRLGKTFLMVTHDQSEALTVSDRMAVMKNGLVAQMGDVRDVYSTPRSHFVADFLGMENFIDASPEGEYAAKTVLGKFKVRQKMPVIDCKLGIRPEDIEIVPGKGDNIISAKVETAIYRGTEQLLLMDNGLQVKSSVNMSVRKGDLLNLQLPEESLAVLYE